MNLTEKSKIKCRAKVYDLASELTDRFKEKGLRVIVEGDHYGMIFYCLGSGYSIIESSRVDITFQSETFVVDYPGGVISKDSSGGCGQLRILNQIVSDWDYIESKVREL